MIDPARVQPLSERPVRSNGKHVLYWMQASQRTRFNHALEYAVEQANELSLPVTVCFGLMDDYPEANARHYAFMLDGLADVAAGLRLRGIAFVVKRGQRADVAIQLADRAALVVCDRGYLRHQKRWRDDVADNARCRVVQVESDVVVPVDVASDKPEFAARTIRPKIHRQWKTFLKPLAATKVRVKSRGSLFDAKAILAKLKLDRSVPPVNRFTGGEVAAGKLHKYFVSQKLAGYDEKRNEPALGHTSTLSPYLHFGQISPIEIALAARDAAAPKADRDAFLEELIIRRELAMNFANFNPAYDRYECLPAWARKTLEQHAGDQREYVYNRAELKSAKTHDPYWNAAQTEMVRTGFMHNYMRMYWGKKIIEWSKTPQRAYETALHLNNKYFLDGRDPVSFANVAWLFGLHDRPWGPARKIFGTVRYMNAAGLERKFDMGAYVKWVRRLAR